MQPVEEMTGTNLSTAKQQLEKHWRQSAWRKDTEVVMGMEEKDDKVMREDEP